MCATRWRSSAGGAKARGVVSLLGLREQRNDVHGCVPRGLMATATSIQALGDADVEAPLWLVTRGAVSVERSDAIRSPIQAQLWGLGLAAGLEYPRRWGGMIDLPDALDERVGSLLAGVLASGGCEDQLAVRGAGVFARRVVRSTRDDGAAGGVWRAPGGTTLITGGTGGLGAHVARWLAAEGAERLLLVSRAGAGAPGAPDLRSELIDLGAEVAIIACDVSDREQVQTLIETVPDDRPLRMIVHAAGSASPGAIDSLTAGELEEALSAKAQGALNLDAFTAGLDLSAFVLFSSIAATFGSAGQAAYAAANACLDALAVQRRARGLTATSVAWGPWAGDGMGAHDEHAMKVLRRRGLDCMAPRPAIEALRQALLHDETLISVADIRWEIYARLFTSARPRPLIEDLPEVRAALVGSAPAEGQVAGGELERAAAERDRT